MTREVYGGAQAFLTTISIGREKSPIRRSIEQEGKRVEIRKGRGKEKKGK